MPMRNEELRSAGDLAASQWGLLTSAQARAQGIGFQRISSLAKSGALERLRYGVYRITGAPSHPHDDLRAAWLALDPARPAYERLRDRNVAVVSHRSAADLHGLGDLEVNRLEFITPRRKQTRDPQILCHRRKLEPAAWTVLDGLPVTNILTTIDDLASEGLDGGHLAGIVRDALTTHHVNTDDLITHLSPYAHRYGAPLGQGETFLHQLLTQVGIPESTHAAARLIGRDPNGPVRPAQVKSQHPPTAV